MIPENEIVMLILGIGLLFFAWANRSKIKLIPFSKIVIASFCAILTGWILTVLEGFFWADVLNFLEHMCYVSSAVLLVVWCWKVFSREKIDKNVQRYFN